MSEVGLPVGSSAGRSSSALVADRQRVRYGREALLRRLLAAADIMAIAATAIVLGLLGTGAGAALLVVASVPVWIITAKLAGLYDRDRRTLRHLTVDELPAIIVWVVGSVIVLTLLLLPFPAFALNTRDRLLLWGFAVGGAFLFRASARALWRRLTPPQRVLVVGEGSLADGLIRKLELFPDTHARVYGRVENCTLLNEHLEALDGVDRVVIACSELNEDLLEDLLPVCRVRNMKLTIVPPSRGMFGTATHLGHVADLPVLDYNTWDIPASTLALKRLFDFVCAMLGLIVLSPVFLLVGLAVLLDDGLPVFFRQLRAGQGGRPFRIFKFRTMVRDAEARLHELISIDELDDPMFKLKDDPRVTRVGRFLRRTSLDELPQLLNVLRGEMSLVGPRPELLDLVDRYTAEHEFRLRVKPGITGPWQVFGRSELTFDEVLAVEREYVENLSLARDVRILLMTLPAVFGRRGAF
jgi:exopolysaccharide biosynthesis polyprenyl glycosylphosphotransferase